MYYTRLASPIGGLLLAGDETALRQLAFLQGRDAVEPGADWVSAEAPFAEARRQIDAYFAGDLTTFALPLAPEGTPFQQSVWKALLEIPYGETVSYGEIARRIGKPSAGRAVGAANGQNPIAIIVPCHRVIGSDGRLTGYGGGLPVKQALLALEQKRRAPTLF